MAKGSDRSAQFLAAMKMGDAEPEPAPASASLAPIAVTPPDAVADVRHMPRKPVRTAAKIGTKPASRDGLKHFGGYLNDEALEKIALLRIRLKMDNSELIAHAIEELYRRQAAKRAFGDA